MSQELKPCPKCGMEAEFEGDDLVACTGSCFPILRGNNKSELATDWNRWAESSPPSPVLSAEASDASMHPDFLKDIYSRLDEIGEKLLELYQTSPPELDDGLIWCRNKVMTVKKKLKIGEKGCAP